MRGSAWLSLRLPSGVRGPTGLPSCRDGLSLLLPQEPAKPALPAVMALTSPAVV